MKKTFGIALVIASLVAPASGRAGSSPESSVPLQVVVSVHPLELILRELGEDDVRIHTLVPSGASPHTFEPKPSDLRIIAEADLFLRVGGGMDDWAQRLMEQAPGLTEVDSLSALLDRASLDSDSPAKPHSDPHIWLDPIAVRDQIAPALGRRLAVLRPDASDRIDGRLRAFRSRLTRLDRDLRDTLEAAPGRRYVAFHNAWRHFARRYDLEEIAVVQEFAGEEPTPKELAFLVRSARRANVPAILVEPQLDPRIAQTIAGDFGAETVIVDPLGDASDPERATYDSLMRFNAAAFARALGS